jgi:hypothetical protein
MFANTPFLKGLWLVHLRHFTAVHGTAYRAGPPSLAGVFGIDQTSQNEMLAELRDSGEGEACADSSF